MSKQKKVFYQRPSKNASTSNADYTPSANHSERIFTVKNAAEGSVKDWIANAIIVVLSISFVFLVLVAIAKSADANAGWSMEENDFWKYISDEYYADIVEQAYHNENIGVTLTPGLRECHAVAKYFEAASLYKAAVFAGDAEDMKKYSATMEECRKELKNVMYVVEDIDLKLGIN